VNFEGQAFRGGKIRTAFSCFALRSIDVTNPPPGGCAMNLQAPLGGDAKGRKVGMLAHANARVQPPPQAVSSCSAGVPPVLFPPFSVEAPAFIRGNYPERRRALRLRTGNRHHRSRQPHQPRFGHRRQRANTLHNRRADFAVEPHQRHRLASAAGRAPP